MQERRNSISTVALTGAALAVAVFSGCGEEAAPVAPVAQPVKILAVGGAGAGAAIEYSGEISPTQNAEPAFEVPGKMVEFPVEEGQQIEAGAVIARLDPRDYEADVDKARANYQKTQTDLKRFKILYEKGVNPITDVEGAQRRADVAAASLKTAEKALEDSTLRAPFSGTVARKLVADFQNVVAKESIIILQDESVLEIRVAVPESDYARMTPGLTKEERTRRARPEVSISSVPGRSFPAWIKEFSTTADPATRTFQATFAFDPPDDLAIRPGMTAKVTLNPGADALPQGTVSIPARAVLTDDTGEAFVWVIDPTTMKARRTPVATGGLAGDRVAITRGLDRGDEIAVSGVHHLRDGMEVRRFGN